MLAASLRWLLLLLVPLLVFLVLAELGLRGWLTRNIFYDVEMSRYATLLKMPADHPSSGTCVSRIARPS